MGKLHEKAKKRTLKSVKSITAEMLNERDENNNTVWHLAAEYGSLKDIPSHLFTEEVLKKVNSSENSVWKIATEYNALKDIPKHLFTTEAMAQKSRYGDTVLHLAAYFDVLKDIPSHLLTPEAMTEKGAHDRTVWHIAKQNNTLPKVLKMIPNNLISLEMLSLKDAHGVLIFNKHSIEQRYITNIVELPEGLKAFVAENNHLDIKDERLKLVRATKSELRFSFPGYRNRISLTKKGVFIGENAYKSINDAVSFIENTLNIASMPENLNAFITENNHLEREVDIKDERLKLVGATKNELRFSFTGYKKHILLTKDGALIDKTAYKTLNDAVRFIEESNSGIEQSIPLPSMQSVNVEQFIL